MPQPPSLDTLVRRHARWARNMFLWAPFGAVPYHMWGQYVPGGEAWLMRRQAWCQDQLDTAGDDEARVRRIVRHSLRVFPPKDPFHGPWAHAIKAGLVVAMRNNHVRAQAVLLAALHAHARWPVRPDMDDVWRQERRLAQRAASVGCVAVFAHMWQRMFCDPSRWADSTAAGCALQLDLVRMAAEAGHSGVLDWIATQARPCVPLRDAPVYACSVEEKRYLAFDRDRQQIWSVLAVMNRSDVAVVAVGIVDQLINPPARIRGRRINAFRGHDFLRLAHRPPSPSMTWHWCATEAVIGMHSDDARHAGIGVGLMSAFARQPEALEVVCATPFMKRWTADMIENNNSFMLRHCQEWAGDQCLPLLRAVGDIFNGRALLRRAVDMHAWGDVNFVLDHAPQWAKGLSWVDMPHEARAWPAIAATCNRRELAAAVGATDTPPVAGAKRRM